MLAERLPLPLGEGWGEGGVLSTAISVRAITTAPTSGVPPRAWTLLAALGDHTLSGSRLDAWL